MSKKNANDKKIIKKILNLLYMTPDVITAKDIYEVISEKGGTQVELWEEMNVLEVESWKGNAMDFEPMTLDFTDPSDISFIKNRDIHTIFSVTVCEDDLEEVKEYLSIVVEKCGGFLCTDSEDFKPFYVGGK